MTAIPRTVDDLTPEWLSSVLGQPVTKVDAAPVGVGVGLVGQLFRLHLEGAFPETMIAKLAAPTDEGRFVPTVLNMYGREHGFYTELSERTPISHPACYYSAHDPETHDSVLLLEDVSPRGAAFDQVKGASLDDVRDSIRVLARLHACFWGDPSLADHPWLLKLSDEPYPTATTMAYEMAWPNVQTFFPDQMTPEVLAYGNAFAGRLPALLAQMCDGPLVLSHADWRLDNLFFAPDGDVIALDWQLIDRSVGPRDLSYLVTQSLELDDPADYERAFTMYADDLAEFGVTLDREWAWEQYRYGAAFGFIYPVVAAGGLTINDPRHLQLTAALLRRSIAALNALDAFSLPL